MAQRMARTWTVLVGGAGFIGRHVAQRLLRAGARVRIATRAPNLALPVLVLARPGQAELCALDIARADAQQFAAALADCDRVVNLAGILTPQARHSFADVHAEGAARLAAAAGRAQVRHFVHVSALGASATSPSLYAQSKHAGEQAVRRALPQAVILRPSLVLGREDEFFGRFGWMARWLPALPLMGGGATAFQPLAVEDMAEAIERALSLPHAQGRIYELGGMETVSFRELMRAMLARLGWRRWLVPLPNFAGAAMSRLTQFMPGPLNFTPDQMRLLRSDNVVSAAAVKEERTLAGLGIAPRPLETMLAESCQRFQAR